MKRFGPEEGRKKLASACLPLAIHVFLRMNIVGELMVSVGERRRTAGTHPGAYTAGSDGPNRPTICKSFSSLYISNSTVHRLILVSTVWRQNLCEKAKNRN